MATVLTPAEIKQKIIDWITSNGQGGITGAHLNTILAAIMDYVGVGYAFMGEAPASAPSPDVPSAYLAAPGTYTSYESGDTVIPEGSIAVLKYDGSVWSKSVIKVCDPVSVSQNTSTGHTDITIGNETTPIPSVEEVEQLRQRTIEIAIPLIQDKSVRLGGEIGVTIDITPQTESGWYCSVIECSEGDKFTISGQGGMNTRLWGFVNSDNTLIAVSAGSLTGDNLHIVAPQNAAYCIINTQTNKTSYLLRSISLQAQMDVSNANINILSSRIFGLNALTFPFAIDAYGTGIETGSCICLSVNANDVINIIKGDNSIRYCVYSDINFANLTFTRATGYSGRVTSSSDVSATMPSDAKYLIVTIHDGTDRTPAQMLVNGQDVGLADEINYIWKTRVNVYPYFAAYNQPSFTKTSTQLSIKFPSTSFRLYNINDGKVILNTLAYQNQSFDLTNGKALVYKINTNTIEVVAFDAVNEPVVWLLSYISGVISGVLSIYYKEDILSDNKTIEEYETPTVFATGKRVDKGGTLITDSYGTIYGPFSVSAGQTIEMQGYAYSYAAAISLCAADGTIIKPLVIGLSNSDIYKYRYTAIADCYVLITNRSSIGSNTLKRLIKYNDIVIEPISFNYSKERTSAILDGKDVVLGHFSDIHADEKATAMIIKLCQNIGVSDILHTGDSARQAFTLGFYDLFSAADYDKVLNVIGNHDGAVPDGGTYDWSGTPVTDVYNTLFKPFISSWNVVQPTDAETYGKCYYYKDYGNVRMIVLNESYWDNSQLTWFNSVLSDSITNNKSVVCVKHSIIEDAARIDCTFSNKFKTIIPMYAINEARDAVDSFIENGGKFVCWLCGHSHSDGAYQYTNQQRKQIVISITTSCANGWVNSDTVFGDAIPTLFNLFGVNTTNKTIQITRIGAKTDKNLRECNNITIDYESGEIIYNN